MLNTPLKVTDLFFSISQKELAAVTLVDNGQVNFVHYTILGTNKSAKSGHFNISRSQGGEEDLNRFIRRSPAMSKWMLITKEAFNLFQNKLNPKTLTNEV